MRRVRKHLLPLLTAFLLVACAHAAAAASDDFPLRPYYPEVPFIDTATLLLKYDDTTVVDIRSSFEYDVAHINKARLLPLSDPDFADELEKIRPKTSTTPMVFYCNGHSCAKSYQAAQLAISLGFDSIYTYDGGIFDWIMAAPDKATLMGETPARADRIISTGEFTKRMLAYDVFAEQALEENTIVIDIRDPFQRELKPRIPGIRNIPLDPLLDLVTSRIWTEKRLLFFDAVGKQVRWLQYFLESYGYFNYAFLRDGVRGLGADTGKVEPVIEANRSVISNQAMLLKVTADDRLNNTDRKLLNYLIANVKFNNYIVVDIPTTMRKLGLSRTLVINSMNRMTRLGYVAHSTMQNNLIAQIDPNLAWKGKVGSESWNDSMAEFNRETGR